MGIKRLFSFLSPMFENINIEQLKGHKIGVDGMAWLYQSFFCNYDSSQDGHIGILRQLELKINLMNSLNIDVG